MKTKIFLMGSCRIHRPFNCDKKHSEGYFNDYDCLNSKWYEKNFIGSIYCSSYILQTLNCLINKKNKELINQKKPQLKMTNDVFAEICDSFSKSEIVIIEIATIKSIIFKNQTFLSNEHISKINNKNYIIKNLKEEELLQNIETIQNILNEIGKQVLFISHFNYMYNIPNRKLIIDCLNKKAKYFLNPTIFVMENIKANTKDFNHYSLNFEMKIMKEIDNCLKEMIINKN
jgi:hypothetical protein